MMPSFVLYKHTVHFLHLIVSPLFRFWHANITITALFAPLWVWFNFTHISCTYSDFQKSVFTKNVMLVSLSLLKKPYNNLDLHFLNAVNVTFLPFMLQLYSDLAWRTSTLYLWYRPHPPPLCLAALVWPLPSLAGGRSRCPELANNNQGVGQCDTPSLGLDNEQATDSRFAGEWQLLKHGQLRAEDTNSPAENTDLKIERK